MDAFVSRRALISSLSLAAMSAGLGACGISGGRSTGLSGSSSLAKSTEQKPLVQQKLESMTLEQKVAQLFLVTPEQFTGVSQAVVAGSVTQRALEDIPVGGLCYFAQNITGDQQLRDLLLGTYSMASRSGAGIAPFLTVDEEGGSLVSRVANSGYFDVQRFPNMAEVGATGDETQAARVGAAIGEYLHKIGFNVDFAPVADVLTNPSNEGNWAPRVFLRSRCGGANGVRRGPGDARCGHNALHKAFSRSWRYRWRFPYRRRRFLAFCRRDSNM